MSQEARLEVFDKNGWRKIYPLPDQPIAHLGSDPGNDVVLAGDYGGQVAPVHAQLIAAGGAAGYQLVNLATTPIVLDPAAPQILPPHSATTLADGQQFWLGEFRLVFYGTGSFYGGPVSNNSPHMGLTLQLVQTELKPGQTLSGTVTVQNLSTKAGVQFEIELFGLDNACFDLEPGPLLSSGAAKDVMLRLYHRGPKPAAGECRISLRATAPHDYPGEQVEVAQTLHILPYYHHRLNLQPPGQAVETPPMAEELLPKSKAGPLRREQPASFTQPGNAATAVSGTHSQPADRPQPPAQTDTSDWWGPPAATPPPPKPPAAVPPSPTAADWWGAPIEPESVPPAQPQTNVVPTPPGWWTTPPAPEPVNSNAARDVVAPQSEQSLPGEVVESPAEEITIEPPPEAEATLAKTPAIEEPSSQSLADTAPAMDKVWADETPITGPSLEAPLEEPAEAADISEPDAEDWWRAETFTRQETPPEDKAPPLAPGPPSVAPDWWLAGPAGGEAVKPAKQIEPPLAIDDETDSSVAKTKPATSAAATNPANNEDIPDWWHAEPADKKDETN